MSVVEQTFLREHLVNYDRSRQPSVRATNGALVCSDVLALTLAVGAALLYAHSIHRLIPMEAYWLVFALAPAAVLAYAACGLYAVHSNPVEELRRTAIASSVFYLGLIACTFLYHDSQPHFGTVIFVWWAVTVVAVPNLRSLTRRLAGRANWWGYPVALVGSPAFIEHMLVITAKNPGNAYVPVIARTLSARSEDSSYFEDCCAAIRQANPHCVILGIKGGDKWVENALLPLLAVSPRVFCLLEMPRLSRPRMSVREYAGAFSLEMKNRLRLTHVVFLKRAVDLTVAITATVMLLPLFAIIAAVVKLTSEGPVFYGHTRYGRNGERFRALKFRSMVTNQDEILERYFAQNPAARTEWRLTYKLRRDPRVTRVGRFLRITSLDELPQLWNVIRNDMSLVGPRPIVDSEVARYGDVFELYKRVPPGITGLWQVSGRNNTTYSQRVDLDEYYVRNWSVWLDLYILIRTVAVVLSREGAC